MPTTLSFYQLKQQVLGWLDDTANTGQLLTNVENAINFANVQRATEMPWSFMRATTTTTITITTAVRYNLPSDMDKLVSIVNTTQNRIIQVVPTRSININDIAGDTFYNTDNRVEVIGPANSTTATKVVKFLHTPAAGDSITVDYYRSPAWMTSSTEIPDIPFPHSLLLVWDSLLTLKSYLLEPDAITVIMDNQQRSLTSLYNSYGNEADVVGGESTYNVMASD